MRACSIVTRSFLAHARVLGETLAEHHADAELTVLVLDGSLEARPEPFVAITPSDLALDQREFRRMATIYDAAELSVALRPWVLRHAMDSGASTVLWLDADIAVYAPLDDLVRLTHEHEILLVPHGHEPIPRDGRTPDELEVLRAGPFSGGVVGVDARARRFLDWWGEPLARDCVIDTDRGLFREKNWLTFVPCYFPHHILRDPTVDLVYWSLHRRQLAWTGSRFEVDGAPLRSFHFTGFDPEKPERVSMYEGPRPRVAPADYPDLARLCNGYAERLVGAGWRDARRTPYGWDVSATGPRLTHRLRRLYREALLASERSGGPDLPDPFDPAQASDFERWLEDPATQRPLTPEERAAFLIERGPLPGTRSGLGRVGRTLRGGVLRAFRSFGDHQREVDRALLAAMKDVEARVERLEGERREP